MIGQEAVATIAVKNLAAARTFYEETLGLKPTGNQNAQAALYNSGKSRVLVYESEYAGTNEATTVTWIVKDEVDDIVRTLKEKGVTFERYDYPGTSNEGDVHVFGDLRVAWFKDPDGNIHSIVNQ